MTTKRKRLKNYHEQIVELAKTMTLSEISRELDLAHSSLCGYMRDNEIHPITKMKSMDDYTEQIKLLAAQGKHNLEIALELGLDTNSVRYHANKLGIEIRNGNLLIDNPDEDRQIIELHNEGYTYNEVADILNISPKRIPNTLDKYGIKRRTVLESFRNNYKVDPNAFSDFESEEAQYWYGWLITDGSISDKGLISFALKSSDGYILEKFADYMGSTTRPKEFKYFHGQMQKEVSQVNYSVMSKDIAERLYAQGLEPRKSCKEKLPKFNWLDGENTSVFWRAVIEGDGSLEDPEKKTPGISLVGSEELLNGFQQYVLKHCGVQKEKPIKSRTYGHPDFRLIRFSGLDAVRIMKVLWSKGSIFLERKKLRAEKFIEKYAEKLALADNK